MKVWIVNYWLAADRDAYTDDPDFDLADLAAPKAHLILLAQDPKEASRRSVEAALEELEELFNEGAGEDEHEAFVVCEPVLDEAGGHVTLIKFQGTTEVAAMVIAAEREVEGVD